MSGGWNTIESDAARELRALRMYLRKLIWFDAGGLHLSHRQPRRQRRSIRRAHLPRCRYLETTEVQAHEQVVIACTVV